MPSITGQFILVIGGSSGIGAGVAKLALAEGLRVAIASSNPIRVANAVKSLQAACPGGDITGYTCDLKQADVEAGLEKLLTEVTAAAGTAGQPRLLDHVICTANVPDIKPVAQADAEYLRAVAQGCVTPTILLAKLAPRFLNKSVRSSIIYTGGAVADRPRPPYTMGSFMAAGMQGVVRSLALELAPALRVNMVQPGATDTELWGAGEQRAQLREAVTKMALLGKPGTAEEVAEAYMYLMKDSNATGSCVKTDGGVLLQ
ncbi:NAD(P)-binding protein [Pleurostoma richardsiae]|uniref:NAD(P)-binding protein n=1 Tax=Pleurostoma richardsiae TaxID=41990 RepID=A0AA38R702_9PEZI|nr:NAD(P)-binding protein [Pleurostoma richardsiae]